MANDRDLRKRLDVAEKKLKRIASAVTLVEEWVGNQDLPESEVVMACLKDIRRTVREL